MAKLSSFSINFSNDQQVYYAGQTVSGTCLVAVDEPLKARGIRVAIRGEANVHWTETRTRKIGSGKSERTETYTEHFRSSEIYFNLKTTLWGKDEGDRKGDNPVLPAGDHCMPFAFQLPSSGLPSSFEGKLGYIRYWLEATIDRPWRYDFKAKHAFSVHEIINVNLPQMNVCIEDEDEKTLCCLCCQSAPLSLFAKVDRAGYCPGEGIAITTRVQNPSNREMRGTRARLIQTTEFYAQASRNINKEDVAVMQGVPIQPHSTGEWRNRLLKIPVIPPTTITCRIIRVTYCLEVTVVVPNSVDLSVEIPLTIGTVPLHQGVRSQAQLPVDRTASPLPFDELPSYAEASGGPATISDTNEKIMGDTKFTPLYPFVRDFSFTGSESLMTKEGQKAQRKVTERSKLLQRYS